MFVFDGLVDHYHETRTTDQTSFDAALQFLVDHFSPQDHSSMMNAGVGTGRIAITIAEHGYQVTGVDLSAEMLSRFQRQIENRDEQLAGVRGDVTALLFVSESFDLALAVHLFYFVGEWQHTVDELFRVLTVM